MAFARKLLFDRQEIQQAHSQSDAKPKQYMADNNNRITYRNGMNMIIQRGFHTEMKNLQDRSDRLTMGGHRSTEFVSRRIVLESIAVLV